MNVLIIEDEIPAQEKIEILLTKYSKEIIILAKLSSVKNCLDWFATTSIHPDLIFMDIQLVDGLSFDIFRSVDITTPIIFTTAYDEYAIDAFKVNGIDYLLKPISYVELSRAIIKFENLSNYILQREQLIALGESKRASTKDRFLVKMGTKIQMINTEDISYIEADGRTVYLHTKAKRKHIVNYTLSEIEESTSAHIFFRVNRSIIAHISDINSVSVYSNSRLSIKMTSYPDSLIIVSRDRVKDFKLWWEGK